MSRKTFMAMAFAATASVGMVQSVQAAAMWLAGTNQTSATPSTYIWSETGTDSGVWNINRLPGSSDQVEILRTASSSTWYFTEDTHIGNLYAARHPTTLIANEDVTVRMNYYLTAQRSVNTTETYTGEGGDLTLSGPGIFKVQTTADVWGATQADAGAWSNTGNTVNTPPSKLTLDGSTLQTGVLSVGHVDASVVFRNGGVIESHTVATINGTMRVELDEGYISIAPLQANELIFGDDSQLSLTFADGFAPVLGDSFNVLDFESLTGSPTLSLPALSSELTWDTDDFQTLGVLRVVPEPTALGLSVLGGLAVLGRRRRKLS